MKFISPTLGLVFAFSGLSHAATISISTSAPTINGADIAALNTTNQFHDWGSSALWGDRPARGQTFTTSTGSYELNSITLRAQGSQSGTMSFAIRIGTISGSSFTQIASETITGVTDNIAANDYFTLILDTPVALSASTLYAFDVSMQSSGFAVYNTNEGFAGGTRYSSGSNGAGGGTISTHTDDRLFHLDITAIPELSSLALTGLSGLLLLRRQR